jgi:endonuclease III
MKFMKDILTLRSAIDVLKQLYGQPKPFPVSDPFELILWENVAYLAPFNRRGQAFELLKQTIGTSPEAILDAKQDDLERVASLGILKTTSAAKLRKCARVAIVEFGGDLMEVIHRPVEDAKAALQSFPGIGEPGSEKILLFSSQQPLLAPDSNGLRVLVRLGLIKEHKSYAQTYAASRSLVKGFSDDPAIVMSAHLLLKQHGQTLCKRGKPKCVECPLSSKCAWFGSHSIVLAG